MRQLILVPGLLNDADLWRDQIAGLADMVRPIVADITQGEALDALAGPVLALGEECFALAGFSLGGIVTLEIMRIAPGRVSHLALLDTTVLPDGPGTRACWPCGQGRAPLTTRPGAAMPPVDLAAARTALETTLERPVDGEDLNGWLMYPKVFTDYAERHRIYGPVRTLPTPAFFYGMEPGEQISVEIDPGKTLEIQLLTLGDRDDAGHVKVFFELNGQPRTVRVPDRGVTATAAARPRAESGNPAHIGAPMPGVVASVVVQPGASVQPGDLLLTIEAMKMETAIHTDRPGTIKAIHVTPGAQIDAKDLLVEME